MYQWITLKRNKWYECRFFILLYILHPWIQNSIHLGLVYEVHKYLRRINALSCAPFFAQWTNTYTLKPEQPCHVFDFWTYSVLFHIISFLHLSIMKTIYIFSLTNNIQKNLNLNNINVLLSYLCKEIIRVHTIDIL